MKTSKRFIFSYLSTFICFQGFSQEDDLTKADLARINRELDNPLASYWSLVFHLGKHWNKGVFIQHWWSYAGDEARNEVVVTDFQYVIRRTFSSSSLGMGPSIRIDWTKSFGEALTFPIGLGYTRIVKLGKTPIKLRIEPQYSLIRPSSYGTVWNIRIQFSPVLQRPFKTN